MSMSREDSKYEVNGYQFAGPNTETLVITKAKGCYYNTNISNKTRLKRIFLTTYSSSLSDTVNVPRLRINNCLALTDLYLTILVDDMISQTFTDAFVNASSVGTHRLHVRYVAQGMPDGELANEVQRQLGTDSAPDLDGSFLLPYESFQIHTSDWQRSVAMRRYNGYDLMPTGSGNDKVRKIFLTAINDAVSKNYQDQDVRYPSTLALLHHSSVTRPAA